MATAPKKTDIKEKGHDKAQEKGTARRRNSRKEQELDAYATCC